MYDSIITSKNRKTIFVLFFVTLILAVYFYFFPQIDLLIARILYIGNGKFVMSDHWLSNLFDRDIDKAIQRSFLLIIPIYLIGVIRKKHFFSLTDRRFAFLIIIPLLTSYMTNQIIKPIYGRARPVHMAEFNGKKTFSGAWAISDQCERNCSFVSGHTTMAFCVVAYALLARKRRKLWMSVALSFASFAGLMRMVRGAHWFSDVLFAGLLTVLVILILKEIILQEFKVEKHPIHDFP